MSDMFTLKTVPLTPELGMALKNFRIENKVTAKSITEKFDKASSYISKLEKGEIKKIESDFLIQLCNYIVKSDDGLSYFLNKLAQNYREYTDETKLIIMNIDDLLLEHTIPVNLVTEMTEYLALHNITVEKLVDTINSNGAIQNLEGYENFPTNIWFMENSDFDDIMIKISVSHKYIKDLLNKKIITAHRIILEAILYSLYELGHEERPSYAAYNKLDLYNLNSIRVNIMANPDDTQYILKGLEPDSADALKNISSNLRLITTISKGYGTKKLKQISNNIKKDLSFSFAFMSIDIEELARKDKEKKAQFLKEVKDLVDKYSQEDTGIDLYE